MECSWACLVCGNTSRNLRDMQGDFVKEVTFLSNWSHKWGSSLHLHSMSCGLDANAYAK